MSDATGQDGGPALPHLPVRRADSHKGDFGRALVIGGSRGMTGAVCLAGMATLRSGAGLVRLAVPKSCLDVVASIEPSYMTLPLPEDSAGRISAFAKDEIAAAAEGTTVLACGPGLGRSSDLDHLVAWLYRTREEPILFDADGLNALAENADVLIQPAGPRILTPHPGEFARLTGERGSRDEQVAAAVRLAGRAGIIVVLKGHQTLVTDGAVQYFNATGNPGMATGGTGDILTGVLTGLLAQGMSPIDAARLGVYVHGLAGDLAANELGQVSMMASDVVRYLPQAFCEFERD
jgi:NAD(P)H-hydrate epimerase